MVETVYFIMALITTAGTALLYNDYNWQDELDNIDILLNNIRIFFFV